MDHASAVCFTYEKTPNYYIGGDDGGKSDGNKRISYNYNYNMSKVIITLKDPDGRPITDPEKARQIIVDYLRADNLTNNPDKVRIKKVDDNGNWSATI